MGQPVDVRNLQPIAARLGPKAVFIGPSEGRENDYRDSIAAMEAINFEFDEIVMSGLPLLMVSRRPLGAHLLDDCQEDPETDPHEHLRDPAGFVAINIAPLGEEGLPRFLDGVLAALDSGEDLVKVAPDINTRVRFPESGDMWATLNNSLELKPNFFGVGINGNYIGQMVQRWRERRRSASA